VDELPTLYFHKIDRLIGTARSNKVSVALGFQELPQLEADYGKVGMQKIITTVGNVVSGSARSKETLEWLSSDIFGKVVQLKKGIQCSDDALHFWVIGYQQIARILRVTDFQVEVIAIFMEDPIAFLGGEEVDG
jgi:hypothetical protein